MRSIAKERRLSATSSTTILWLTIVVCYCWCSTDNSLLLHVGAFSLTPFRVSHPFYRLGHEGYSTRNPEMVKRKSPVDLSAAALVDGSDTPKGMKRQKVGQEHPEPAIAEEDPFLTLIPEALLAETTTENDVAAHNDDAHDDAYDNVDHYDAADDHHDQSPPTPSLKYLPLPSKLAYPFWYDPHPIAKWAAGQLKDELPPYDEQTTSSSGATTTPPTQAITLGKMYGVLVVRLNDGDITKKDGVPATQSTGRLGCLRAYSGTMPRPQYGESPLAGTEESDYRFVPPVYDRFAEDDADDFDYEREEEILNELTHEIELMDNSPERKAEEERLEAEQAKVASEIYNARIVQRRNKEARKEKRKKLRDRLLAEDNESHCNKFMSANEAHMCFLEYNDYYRDLENQLVQESAADQRQFKAIKSKAENELKRIHQALEEHHSQIDCLRQIRKDGSKQLQQRLFERYKFLNISGETKNPLGIFKNTPLRVPPSGTGDCAAIKLFQHAFSKGYHPVALAEFWWGPSPHTREHDVARTHGNYYPCCRGKCEPILTHHILKGIDVESDPLTQSISNKLSTTSLAEGKRERELSIIYEDQWMVVVNKPHDVLSVPGRNVRDSIKRDLQIRYPEATGPLLVHRLDYSTSGLLLGAKSSKTHKQLQSQFIARTVSKRYEALLEGDLQSNQKNSKKNKVGTIDLPLAGDYLHRPMQKVERGPEGKSAVTHYEIVEEKERNTKKKVQTRVYFYPQTGRTHQLRVHASHPEGLGMAILGDDIYGKCSKRLCLHAGLLEFDHPHTKERVSFEAPVPF